MSRERLAIALLALVYMVVFAVVIATVICGGFQHV